MRNVSPIAEREVEEMFEKYDGNFVAVCEALDEEMEANDGRTDDQDAAWERFGLDADDMRKAKSARPKKPNYKS